MRRFVYPIVLLFALTLVACGGGGGGAAGGGITPPPTETVTAPQFNTASGTYTSAQNVTISTTTTGATVRYTIDGSTPSTTVGTVYSGAVVLGLNSTTTVKAIAYKTGMNSSSVTSGTFTVTGAVAPPTFNVTPGTYTSAQTVALSTTTLGASIRYTLDNTTPTSSTGTLYTGAIPLDLGSSTPIKAIAFKANWADSAISSGTYTITGTVATPTFSVTPGTYTTAQSVEITSTTPGAVIRYTLDNTTPDSSNGTVYTGAVSIGLNSSTTIKAIAYQAAWADSAIASGTYVVTGTVASPTMSPASGTYAIPQAVTISSATVGAIIRYTTDGSTPTSINGAIYSRPVVVGSNSTLRAIAYRSDWLDSSVTDAPFTILWTAVSAGSTHAIALRGDGIPRVWGANDSGQIGDGTTIERNLPVWVQGLTNLTALSAGNLFASAVKNDGTVWAWGRNQSGQLGDNTTVERHNPVQAVGISGVSSVASGWLHTVALKNDGTVWAWGWNGYGQLGDTTTTDRHIPTPVPPLCQHG